MAAERPHVDGSGPTAQRIAGDLTEAAQQLADRAARLAPGRGNQRIADAGPATHVARTLLEPSGAVDRVAENGEFQPARVSDVADDPRPVMSSHGATNDRKPRRAPPQVPVSNPHTRTRT